MPYATSLDRLRAILHELREKCPWDKKQTFQSLRPQTLEEVYELADTITREDWQGLKEELGDVLLHVLFYAHIASEQNLFTLEDVIKTVCDKLIFRHPHVYAQTQVANEEEVKQNWERLKLKEGKKSVLSGVPGALPAMVKAFRLQEKTKQVGFEWSETKEVWQKVGEELQELEESVTKNNPEKMEEEFGDLLFALVNYARFLKIDPENALERTNKKFIRRFQFIEKEAERMNLVLQEMSLDEMDKLWDEAKKREKHP
jgi:MazG family protein